MTHVPDLLPIFIHIQLMNLMPINLNLASSWRIKMQQKLSNCAFPASRRTYDGGDGTFSDLHGDILEHCLASLCLNVMVAKLNMVNLDLVDLF